MARPPPGPSDEMRALRERQRTERIQQRSDEGRSGPGVRSLRNQQQKDLARGTIAPQLIVNPGNAKWHVTFTYIPNGAKVGLEGWVTEFADNYTSEWNAVPAYGRMDPMATFQRTGRVINMTIDLPAANVDEALLNTGRVDTLIKFLYPVYNSGGRSFSNTLKSAPLIGLRWANLANPGNSAEEYLVGYMGGINYTPNFEAGVFVTEAGKMYPQHLTVTFQYTVLHTHLMGWAMETTKEFRDVGDPTQSVVPHPDSTKENPLPGNLQETQEQAEFATTNWEAFGGPVMSAGQFPHGGSGPPGGIPPNEGASTPTGETRTQNLTSAETAAAGAEALEILNSTQDDPLRQRGDTYTPGEESPGGFPPAEPFSPYIEYEGERVAGGRDEASGVADYGVWDGSEWTIYDTHGHPMPKQQFSPGAPTSQGAGARANEGE